MIITTTMPAPLTGIRSGNKKGNAETETRVSMKVKRKNKDRRKRKVGSRRSSIVPKACRRLTTERWILDGPEGLDLNRTPMQLRNPVEWYNQLFKLLVWWDASFSDSCGSVDAGQSLWVCLEKNFQISGCSERCTQQNTIRSPLNSVCVCMCIYIYVYR